MNLNKPLKIVVGTNSLANTTQIAYANHMQFWFLLGKRFPHFQFCFVNPPRMSIDRMRNLCAKTALEIEADYILFLDDDVLIPNPFDALAKLLALEADIAAGDVLVRGYPFNHMIFKWHDRKHDQMVIVDKVAKKRGPMACDAVGFSLCLINAKILKKIPQPYFVTGVNNTEDIYFCIKAQNNIDNVKIMVDTSIICGHILGLEVIDDSNKAAYKAYHERIYGKPDDRHNWRGEDYLAEAKGAINARKAKIAKA